MNDYFQLFINGYIYPWNDLNVYEKIFVPSCRYECNWSITQLYISKNKHL